MPVSTLMGILYPPPRLVEWKLAGVSYFLLVKMLHKCYSNEKHQFTFLKRGLHDGLYKKSSQRLGEPFVF